MSDNTLFTKYGQVYDSGKIIFKENDKGDQMYIIQEGSVKISKNIAGKDHVLAILNKGNFFGEMAIVNQVSRTATATAVGTVRLLAFDREGFIGMIEKNAKIALNVIDKLCRRLQQANMQIHHLVNKDEDGLIALNLYYTFAENTTNNILPEIKTGRDIALNLELPQESVLAYFAKLEKSGVLKIENNNLILNNKEELYNLAEKVGKK